MNGNPAPWLWSLVNELALNFMPGRKWELQVSGEHFRNEISHNTFKNMMLLDSKAVFKLTKRIELSASLTNILNRREYSCTTYSDLSSYERRYSLRGRQLLFSITLRK